MNKIDNSIFYKSAQKARNNQELKDLKYNVILLKKSLEKTVEAKENAKYKKDCDIIEISIINFKKQIEEFEKRIQELLLPESI